MDRRRSPSEFQIVSANTCVDHSGPGNWATNWLHGRTVAPRRPHLAGHVAEGSGQPLTKAAPAPAPTTLRSILERSACICRAYGCVRLLCPAQPSAHRLLHRRTDPCLGVGGRGRQSEGGGHLRPSSRFVLPMKPNVAYLVLNLCAGWRMQTTLPSLAYAGILYQGLGVRPGALALMTAWSRSPSARSGSGSEGSSGARRYPRPPSRGAGRARGLQLWRPVLHRRSFVVVNRPGICRARSCAWRTSACPSFEVSFAASIDGNDPDARPVLWVRRCPGRARTPTLVKAFDGREHRRVALPWGQAPTESMRPCIRGERGTT